MIPASFSIKGFASIRFADSKDNMESGKIWKMLSTIWSYYPKKVELLVSQKRGAPDKTAIEDERIRDAMYKMIGGCIETCDVQAAVGRATNLLLGQCYEYRIPFGVRSSDTGHTTMLLPLPLPMDGCYILSARLDGSLKKSRGKEHYMAEMQLDIHVGTLQDARYEELLQKGLKVYPFKLRNPDYFPTDDSSGSEFNTDTSDTEKEQADDAVPLAVSSKPKPKSILRATKKRGGKRRLVMGAAVRSALDYLASTSQKEDDNISLRRKEKAPLIGENRDEEGTSPRE